jgi:hypothetical protein
VAVAYLILVRPHMLLLKRLITSVVLFLVLSIIFFTGALAVAGAVVGAQAGVGNPAAQDFASGYALGHAAGYEVGKRYGGVILRGSLATSALASIAISFSGILPWCRKRSQPPPLPKV